MKRIRHDLDVIKEESEARISKKSIPKVSESNKKLNTERINVARWRRLRIYLTKRAMSLVVKTN
ncbi:CGH_1_HP_G0103930.mRNA.1.CDS.1 [Saccharomyces cerevisiae]|nr:CGH_1_HP_G0103930.mRNA.1.CDS.1 [Saccharomyces cerevisiae]CAI6951129.1 CGH_1_HP_G0103930.mRNA.1.CDS.1 [Saccharomyces cerevisiae]